MDVRSQNTDAFTLIITLSMVINSLGANVTTTSETELVSIYNVFPMCTLTNHPDSV